jgi:sulfite reductase (NADPH) flavoprotein alpha-component
MTIDTSGAANVALSDESEEFPWHDSSLPIVQRMDMAQGRPREKRLMAAMAQLNCGSCGYLCQTYAEAIASGEESNLTLCSPGGKETKQMIKKVLSEPAAENGQADSPRNGHSSATSSSVGWSRQNPFSARLIVAKALNRDGSAKDTRHVAIDLSGSGLRYEAGDALGVFPVNCGELAESIVSVLGADPNTTVRTPLGNDKSLFTALCEDCCLRDPSDELIELLRDRVSASNARASLQAWLDEGVPAGTDVLDVLDVARGATVTGTEVIELLDPLNPRLYSIASSMKVVGEEVHLTVGKVTYERAGRLRKGAASTMLSDRISPGETVRLFVQPNHGGFSVPRDPNTPMIMVGPGTGIAPFLAFLQERGATSASGKNWLFFGDQCKALDFLYQDELEAYVNTGLLSRLDTAFSRDGTQKVYVQHRMKENAGLLWQWLEEGAHFFVCGDASRMAADVERTLLEIIVEQGDMSAGDAKGYLANMTKTQRYVRDVY